LSRKARRDAGEAFRNSGTGGTAAVPPVPAAAYTIEGLAKFLGVIKKDSQRPKDSFIAAFESVELIEQGYLTESKIRDIQPRRLGEVVQAIKAERLTQSDGTDSY
jgi:hypothetical protein